MASSSVSVSCVPITHMKNGQAYVMDKLIRDIEFACRLIIQKSNQLGEVNFDHRGMWCFLLDNFKLMDNAFENLGLKGNASTREDGIHTSYTSYSDFVPRIPQSGRINTRLLANTVAVTIMHDIVANLANIVAKVAEEYRVSIPRPGSGSLIPTKVAEFNCFAHPLATSFAENAGGAFTVAVDVFIASVEILVSFDVTQGKFNFEMDPTLPRLPAEMGTCMVKRKLNQKMIWEPMMWDRYKPFTCMVYNSNGETHEALIERVKQLCRYHNTGLLIVTNTREIDFTHGDPWPILEKMPFPKFSYYGPPKFKRGGFWIMWHPAGVQIEFREYSEWELRVKVGEQLVSGVC